jgi:hypothetical protein
MKIQSKIYIVFVTLLSFLLSPIYTQNLLAAPDDDESQVIIMTNGLLGQIKDLIKAQEKDKPKQVERIKDRIEKRKERILKLLDKRPERAVKYILPKNILSQFPGEIVDLLETDVEIQGDLYANFIDYTDGSSKMTYQIRDEKNPKKRIRVHFAKNPDNSKLGKKVRIKGTRLDAQNIVAYADSSAIQPIAAATTLPAVSGDRKLLVIPVNFLDKALSCTPSALNGQFFTNTQSIKNYYSESSGNRLNFSGDVAPTVTIPHNSTENCDYDTWGDNAVQAVTNLGYNVNNYQHILFEVPSASSCGFAGVAYISMPAPARSWVLTCNTADTVQPMNLVTILACYTHQKEH